MEPAGAAVSIFALFVECLKAYKLYSTASYLTPDLKIVKTKFQIEETRFAQWGIHWGYGASTGYTLDETVESAGRNAVSTVRLTLAQISTLLKEYETVSARYNDPGRGQVYRGMVWALKDKARLESIISNLNDFNNALHQLLPRQNEHSLSQAVACALTGSNEGRELDDLIAAMGSLRFNDAAKLARFKRAYQMLSMEDEQEVAQLPASPSTLQVDVGRFQFSSRYSSENRTFGSLDNSFRVIVEWKAYHPSMTSGSATSRMILRHRASHLAELMSGRSQRPEGFNVLSCAGYFDQVDRERFGFAYEFPLHVVRHMPFTLHEMLTPTKAPDLGTRFKMAQSLSRTLNLLHASGWLHKSIRSSNILIFQAEENNAPAFDRPYLVGFGFSRPDGYGEETFHERSAAPSVGRLYRHPDVQGPHPRRYQASDDIYSLGLVLLEIALWMPLTHIDGRRDTSSQAPLNAAGIMSAVSSLPRKVGRIYKDAVEKCLNTSQEQTEPSVDISAAEWNAVRLRKQNQFYWDVVKKLEECRA